MMSTVTTKNQVAIPAKLIQDLKIKKGDRVLVDRYDDWIRVMPIKENSFLDLAGVLKGKIKKKIDFQKLRKNFEKSMGAKI